MTTDTYTWLLNAEYACPFCGADLATNAVTCEHCGQSLVVIYRPETRSPVVVTLVSLWGIGAFGGSLMVIGMLMERAGMVQYQRDPSEDPQVLKSLARIMNIQSFDQSVASSSPPPAWLFPSLVALTLLALVMAWGTYARKPFVLYVAIGIAVFLGIAGAGAGFALTGVLAITPLLLSVLVSATIILAYLSAASQLLGEPRRIDTKARATSPIGLYAEGQRCYEQGMFFLAARRWAQGLGREPRNIACLHALGLALVKLGQYDRALEELDLAIQVAPGNLQIRESYELARQQRDLPPEHPAQVARQSRRLP